jgi:hypothetical protein
MNECTGGKYSPPEKTDVLVHTQAVGETTVWVGYPSIAPGGRMRIHTAAGWTYIYISLFDAMRFEASPLDNRKLVLKTETNWLDDARLSLKAANRRQQAAFEFYYWDRPVDNKFVRASAPLHTL